MRKIVLILILLFSRNSVAQINTICANYTITVQDDKDIFKSNKAFRTLFESSIGLHKSFQFQLNANRYESKFFNKSIIDSDYNNLNNKFIIAMAGYSGEVFQYKDSIYKKDQNLQSDIYEISEKKRDWILSNETKLIDNYICYKATSTLTVQNSVGNFNHKVIAWFCPKIPISSGPNGYGNLPGLILELQVRNIVYGLSSIILNCSQDISNSFLHNAKTITYQERMKLYEKMN